MVTSGVRVAERTGERIKTHDTTTIQNIGGERMPRAQPMKGLSVTRQNTKMLTRVIRKNIVQQRNKRVFVSTQGAGKKYANTVCAIVRSATITTAN